MSAKVKILFVVLNTILFYSIVGFGDEEYFDVKSPKFYYKLFLSLIVGLVSVFIINKSFRSKSNRGN